MFLYVVIFQQMTCFFAVKTSPNMIGLTKKYHNQETTEKKFQSSWCSILYYFLNADFFFWSQTCMDVYLTIKLLLIIILFLQYSHTRSSHVPEMWPILGLMFNILLQTPFKGANQPIRIEKIVQNRTPGTLKFFFSCFLIMIFFS
jgi:hypothetical protein